MDKVDFLNRIKELCDYSNKLSEFQNDEELFLNAIKNLDKKYLTVELDKFKDGSINWQGMLKPVNFLKYLVIDAILTNKTVTLEVISEYKKKILLRDVDYFRGYPDFKEAMLKLEDGKNFFHQWNNIFKTLFYVYYDQYKETVMNSMTEISEHLKVVLNMRDCKTTVNGFGWNNNYGSSDCWIALYPADRESHQQAYQIFLRVNPTNELVYGVINGSEMPEKKKLDRQNGQNVNVDKLERFLFNEAKPEYERLNVYVLPKKTEEENPESAIIDEKHPKNMILYGCPGTGKTYETYGLAVQIVEPNFKHKDREELVVKFRELQKNGYITFVTFHQSYSYEEFVEGYRYDEESKIPKIESGVFKTLVESAKADVVHPKKKIDLNLTQRNVFKISLGDTTLEGDEDIYEYCKENSVIALGYGGKVDYAKAYNRSMVAAEFEKIANKDEDSAYNVTAINYFKNVLKKEDLVFVSKGNRTLRAIGKVTGDYSYNTNVPIRYPHFRKVEWIVVDNNIPVEKIMKKIFSQATIYEIRKEWLNVANLSELLEKPGKAKKDVKNYVLVIDEINRGNISRIFGELITLIEDDKRLGMSNEMVVKLPYSKESDFGVPQNIHIIGTMNTADRSIALMDVALRRRFSFKRVSPDSRVIRDLLVERGLNEEVVEIIANTFNMLNKRIRVLLDEDHLLGHSYFLNISKENIEYDLHAVWYDKIVPLVQEYFYNDWDKIRLLLGEYNATSKTGFVRSLESEYKGIFGSQYDDDYPYEIICFNPDNFSQILMNTFGKTNEQKR